jgi:hypothetical protein
MVLIGTIGFPGTPVVGVPGVPGTPAPGASERRREVDDVHLLNAAREQAAYDAALARCPREIAQRGEALEAAELLERRDADERSRQCGQDGDGDVADAVGHVLDPGEHYRSERCQRLDDVADRPRDRAEGVADLGPYLVEVVDEVLQELAVLSVRSEVCEPARQSEEVV